jgi:S-adenosylmethionine:tRNA ribosyltransferase-isomerase
VAAPTASLHFTKRIFKNLKKQKIDVKFITLHVGLGTFATLTKENLKNKKLHQEFYNIDKKTAEFLNKAKKDGKIIIAVGTTVARTLESASEKGILKKYSGKTDIFISEGYKFNFVNGLITNFHVSKSSLLMLVSAIIGRKKVLEIYKKAINKKFRFYSFGDGMLII